MEKLRFLNINLMCVSLVWVLAACDLVSIVIDQPTPTISVLERMPTETLAIPSATASSTNTLAVIPSITAAPTNTATMFPTWTPTNTLTITPTLASSPGSLTQPSPSSTTTSVSLQPAITLVRAKEYVGGCSNVFMRFWVTPNGQRLTELNLKLHKGLVCNEGSNLLMEDVQTIATVLEINTRIINQKFELFKTGFEFWGEIHGNKAEGFLYLDLNKYFPNGVVKQGSQCTLGPFYWTTEVK